MTYPEFLNELKKLDLEIISRSGISSKEVAQKITSIVNEEMAQKINAIPCVVIDGSKEFTTLGVQRYKEEYLNRWMTLHHELIVRKQHFNWNWP